MDDNAITALGVRGLAAAFAAGGLTPSAALGAFRRRIVRINPRINAFLSLQLIEAQDAAALSDARWRRGAPLSQLDGAPFGVKANIALAGAPWHAGIDAYREQIATEDAHCVAVLKRAGAIPLGILNMHEGALGATTDNAAFGRCRNPWNLALTPGGSSGGSAAAVAARLCAFSLGTDTMGSVRIPSAYCGIAGAKPSFGLVATGGVIELSPTLDHVGAHAADVADLQVVMRTLGGVGMRQIPGGLRVGVADWGDAVAVEAEVTAAFDAGITLLRQSWGTQKVDVSAFPFGALRRRGLLISEVEGAHAHQAMLAAAPLGFSPELRALLDWGARQPPSRLADARAAIEAAASRFSALFDKVDVLVMPTAPQPPFSFDDETPANQADLTAIANFAGMPAVAAPAVAVGAPPASIQFITRRGDDALALEVAAEFERMRGAAPSPPDVG
jgi:aspartyl-tRNA(Asn)/glutamyl-tRNA(Gln) amidotransferase subunit A